MWFLVRCYGTEDRPSAHPVLSRDEVYEYIIFKACDIKDLVVCEPPNRGLPRDPAIVSFAPYRSRPGLGKSVPNILNLSQRSGNNNCGNFLACRIFWLILTDYNEEWAKMKVLYNLSPFEWFSIEGRQIIN